LVIAANILDAHSGVSAMETGRTMGLTLPATYCSVLRANGDGSHLLDG